jgi:cytochrome c-type biogenesis protein
MNEISPLTFGFALGGGLLTILSPCVLPVIPLVLGRSFKSHRLGPVMLVLGLVSGFAVIGSLLGVASSWFVGFANLLRNVAVGLLFGLGVLAIFPEINYRLMSYLQFGKTWEPKEPSLWSEFWIGTQLGLLWTPCAGPALGSILVLAAVKHEVLGALALLTVYGLGAGIPLLAIAYSSRYVSNSSRRLLPYAGTFQRIGGILMAGTAIAILLGWDVEFQLWLAPLFPQLPL